MFELEKCIKLVDQAWGFLACQAWKWRVSSAGVVSSAHGINDLSGIIGTIGSVTCKL